MNLRDARRQRREHPDMEITPLIDVVFLLLIFFVVTTSFSQASGGQGQESEIDVELPEAATGRAASESRWTRLPRTSAPATPSRTPTGGPASS